MSLPCNQTISSLTVIVREEVDDEMEEWEQAQLRRGGMKAEEETALASVKQVYKAATSAFSLNTNKASIHSLCSTTADTNPHAGFCGRSSHPSYDFFNAVSWSKHQYDDSLIRRTQSARRTRKRDATTDHKS